MYDNKKLMTIVVSYDAKSNDNFPNYNMIDFPETWDYSGCESALKSQQEFVNTNAYFHGPTIYKEKAKESIRLLFERYKCECYLSKFIIQEFI